MKFKEIFITVIFIVWATAPNARAAAGDIDPTFGSGGRVTFGLVDMQYQMAIQSDDKLLLVGTTYDSATNKYFVSVRRYNANGSTDMSFGLFGETIPLSHDTYSATEIAVLTNGKILIGGTTYNGSNDDFFVARLLSNGYLDTSFGTGGIAAADFSAGDDQVMNMAIRADGKIVLAGMATLGTVQRFGVARFNSNGTPDTTFSTNGKAVAGWGNNNSTANAVELLTNGKIVAGGVAHINNVDDFALAQFNPDGSLDTDFGTNGRVITPFVNGPAHIDSILLLTNPAAPFADKKIVAVGGLLDNSPSGTHSKIALARFNPNGSLDTSFGSGGKTSTPPFDPPGDQLGSTSKGSFFQADGKLVVVTATVDFWGYVTTVTRFNSSGSKDTSFGGGTGQVVDFDHQGARYDSGGRQSDGKLIIQATGFIERLLP